MFLLLDAEVAVVEHNGIWCLSQGADLTCGVDAFSLEFQIASETIISLGLKVENTTATWVNFDNFKLERLESTTGIHVISASPTKKNAVIYNLWGQKLSKPQKGINIIDGKKVFIK